MFCWLVLGKHHPFGLSATSPEVHYHLFSRSIASCSTSTRICDRSGDTKLVFVSSFLSLITSSFIIVNSVGINIVLLFLIKFDRFLLITIKHITTFDVRIGLNSESWGIIVRSTCASFWSWSIITLIVLSKTDTTSFTGFTFFSLEANSTFFAARATSGSISRFQFKFLTRTRFLIRWQLRLRVRLTVSVVSGLSFVEFFDGLRSEPNRLIPFNRSLSASAFRDRRLICTLDFSQNLASFFVFRPVKEGRLDCITNLLTLNLSLCLIIGRYKSTTMLVLCSLSVVRKVGPTLGTSLTSSWWTYHTFSWVKVVMFRSPARLIRFWNRSRSRMVWLDHLWLKFCNLALLFIFRHIIVVVVLCDRRQSFLRSVWLLQLVIIVDQSITFSAWLWLQVFLITLAHFK